MKPSGACVCSNVTSFLDLVSNEGAPEMVGRVRFERGFQVCPRGMYGPDDA